MGVFPPFLLENILIGSTHTMSPLTYKEFECRAGMSNWGTWKAWAASWPFASGRPWAFGGGGRGERKKQKKRKKKWWAPEATTFFFFFFATPPAPAPVSCLLIPLLCLPHPYSSPIRKLLIAMPFLHLMSLLIPLSSSI